MTLLCPECRSTLEEGATAHSCGWRLETVDGVPVYLSSVDRNSAVFDRYSDNYDQIAQSDLTDDILDPRYVEHQASNVIRLVRSALAGADACDIGAGQGCLARRMIAAGARKVIAVDIATVYLRRIAGAKIEPVLANAENLPFEEAFDVITATDVAEHVLNIGSLLYCANQALRPGGLLLLRVPYRENLLNYSPHVGCGHPFGHLRSFNKVVLRDLLTESGFEVERFRFDGFWLSRPQPFWMTRNARREIYFAIQRQLTKRLASPTDVTSWPAWLASLLMPAQEILALARKRQRIRPEPEGGYSLEPV